MSSRDRPKASRVALTVGFCAFVVIAAVFLWTEHRAHLGGWLPFLVLLLCPLIHFFMHRGHHHHNRGEGGGSEP